jgi:hypothetical protein
MILLCISAACLVVGLYYQYYELFSFSNAYHLDYDVYYEGYAFRPRIIKNKLVWFTNFYKIRHKTTSGDYVITNITIEDMLVVMIKQEDIIVIIKD